MTPDSEGQPGSGRSDSFSQAEPAKLAAVLGEDVIASALYPFVDYLETSVVTFELDGTQIGEPLLGNDYCRLLVAAGRHGMKKNRGFCCYEAGRSVALSAMESGKQEETVCSGGLALYAVPIYAGDRIIGACVGCISEPPVDDDAVMAAAKACEADFQKLRNAAGSCYHKPDYLFDAARKHLEQLAHSLGGLYISALEKEEAVFEIAQRETELAAAKELDERILSSTAACIVTVDEDLKVTLWNRAAELLTGIPSGEAVGRELAALLPTTAEGGFTQEIRQVMETGKAWHGEPARFSFARTGEAVLDTVVTPLRDEAGNVSGALLNSENVTRESGLREELTRRVSELEALNTVITAASRSLEPEEVLFHTAEAVKEAAGADFAVIYLLEKDTRRLALSGYSGKVQPESLKPVETYEAGEGLLSHVAETGETQVIVGMDESSASAKGKKIAREFGLKNAAFVPIKSRDDVLGVMAILSAGTDICSPEQVRFFDLLADQLSIAIQNSKLYAATGATNRFLTSLLDSMAECAYTADINGTLTYLNPAAEAVTGYNSDELVGRPASILIPEEGHEKIYRMLKLRWKGKTSTYDIDVIRKDGRRLTLRQTVSPLFQNEEVVGLVGVATDVTEQKRLEHDLKQKNQRLFLLQSAISKSVSELPGGKALETLVDEVASTFGYDFCSIFLLAPDGKKLQIVANHGYNRDFVKQMNDCGAFSLDNEDVRKTPLMHAFIDGEQTTILDVFDADTDPRLVDSARRHGLTSVAATPLEYMGERLGAIEVYTRDRHEFGSDELELLASVSAQVSSIVGSALVYERLAESEERYRELYDTAVDWIYMLDSEGRILDCNRTMSQALGYKKQELAGRHIYDFESAEDREKAKADLPRVHASGFFAAERVFLTEEGRQRTMDLHARLIVENGEVSRWQVVARDITEKKEAERRINLLASAVENAHEYVFVTDMEDRIISINQAGAAALGISAGEMEGQPISRFWSERNPSDLKHQVNNATFNGEGWQGQALLSRADGAAVPVFLSTASVKDEKGKPIAIVSIARDVSEEQRMTREIMRRNRELAVLNAVSATAAESLDLESTLQACLSAVLDSMGYNGGLIFLLDEKDEKLVLRAALGFPPELVQIVRTVNLGDGYSGIIAQSRQPLFIEEDRLDNPGRLRILDRIWWASIGGVPLIIQDRLVGVMMVATAEHHAFSDAEKALLTSVGETVGVAIDNARLFRDVAAAKNQWETTFDAMTNGVSIHDTDFNIIRANQALATLLGTSTEALIGRKCYEIFHNLPHPIGDCAALRVLSTGRNVTVVLEEPYLGKILSLSADPVHDEEGNITGVVHDVRDITEQERLRDQVNQSDKLTALGEMAGGVAHDFNNFLTVILGNAQLMLATGDFDEENRESLETIERAAANAAETVRRIQEFTRVRTARSFNRVDLNAVVREAVEVARPRWRDEAEARGIAIDVNVGLEELPPISANEAELAEVLINLILNAADAMPEGGQIDISTRKLEDGVEVVVADNGSGMDEEVRKRIFEPFFSTKGAAGSGLGLSVAYGIVGRHAGEIMVESRQGEGATFTVRLPVIQVDDENIDAPATDVAMPERPARVLVIDDADMIRVLLVDILEGIGSYVEASGSGTEGLMLFEEARAGPDGPFDIVLTDLGMPGMSGWEVAEKIKKISPDTPVALITGWGDQLDPEKMAESKVDTVIAKPFRMEEVRALVARAIAERDRPQE